MTSDLHTDTSLLLILNLAAHKLLITVLDAPLKHVLFVGAALV